jgi:anti-anti-sigma regulatory factor
MDKSPKIEIDPAGTVVTARYCGHITAADLQADLVDAALASKVRSRFTLLVDLSALDSMDQSCARLWIALTIMVSQQLSG